MTSFDGFQVNDFSTAIRGTQWRNRRALGGDLSLGLRRIYGRRYQTWGLPGSNTLHIARRSEYRFRSNQSQASLFVSLSPEYLRWGFNLPSSGDHGQRLIEGLQHEASVLPMLLYVLNTYQLTLTDIDDSSGGVLGGCWLFEQGELIWREACSLPRTAIPADIIFRLTEIPLTAVHALVLYAQTDVKTALVWGDQAADILLPTLTSLIPLYELCVSPGP